MGRPALLIVPILMFCGMAFAMYKGATVSKHDVGEPTIVKFPKECNYVAKNYLGGLGHDTGLAPATMNLMLNELDACSRRNHVQWSAR